ncbi:ABC transporter ATP binding protein [Methanocella paludicola SANAE]|uniref:ABC transporter ATP binding protein n=1 Tax=Methanocella paludicola (strain DSM 17711 / JCM 13418 / NBRC 101707 / SANAE) TaxID=304371 RepID=D1YXI0_METPS|nr:metal ABC transporter ATP-binding protein [Methanocella paludicola]BAI61152.1 ABC transporter ATP binding protein [Methanocella paludicola SANAE]
MRDGDLSVIELKGIYTAYEGGDKPVIKDLSLSVGQGEFVVIGGPNGAGKTTLLESINGLVRITHGYAMVCGLDVRRSGNDVRKKVGYVIQNFYFDPFTPFTVGQVVMMGRYGRLGFFNRPSEADHRAADKAIRMAGIEDLVSKPIGTLSGGQQQKAMIAHNIAKEPDIMLLDEPFSNLDFRAREYFQGVLKDIVKKGTPVVMVSHAFDGLPDVKVRLVIMSEGRISADMVCNSGDVEGAVRRACVVG